jgi:hypothetical protein
MDRPATRRTPVGRRSRADWEETATAIRGPPAFEREERTAPILDRLREMNLRTGTVGDED